MSIFPAIAPTVDAQRDAALPMAKEVKWDYDANRPVFRGGAPLVVEGKEAVKVWIWKALHVERFRHEIYSWDYGCELYSLIGQAFTQELKQTEAARYLRECLLINKYITDVRDVVVTFSDARLHIDCTAVTIYGEVGVTTYV